MTNNQINYRSLFLRLANKVRRQRDRYAVFRDHLEKECQSPSIGYEQALEKLGKMRQSEFVVRDLDFVIAKACESATEEDRKVIHGKTI